MHWNGKHYRICKRLCYLLRHAPSERDDLAIRCDGFIRLDRVLLDRELYDYEWEDILYVIRTNYKQRFVLATNDTELLYDTRLTDIRSFYNDQSEIGNKPAGFVYKRSESCCSLIHSAAKHEENDDAADSDTEEVSALGDNEHHDPALTSLQEEAIKHSSSVDTCVTAAAQKCQEVAGIKLNVITLDSAVWNYQSYKHLPSSLVICLNDLTAIDVDVELLDTLIARKLEFAERMRQYAELKVWKSLFIRASQGHSLPQALVRRELIYKQIENYRQIRTCIHGTTLKSMIKILDSGGIRKMGRSYIHFARGLPGSPEVISGIRIRSDIAIFIDTEKCLRDGTKFYMSSNGVILTEGIEGCISVKYFNAIARLRYE